MTVHDPAGMAGPHIIESLLRQALVNRPLKQKVLEETGWDDSMPSKVCAGTAGISLDKLDAICRALGLTIVEVSYMDYLARGNEIGSRCCKARASLGNCGAR